MSLQAWITRKYYKLFPRKLFEEALDYLQLSYYEQLCYAGDSSLSTKAYVLLHVVLTRMAESDKACEDLFPLLQHLGNLFEDKGWW